MIKEMIVKGKIIVNQRKLNQSLRTTEEFQNQTMSKKNIKETNTQRETPNKPDKTELMTEHKITTEVVKEIMTEEKTEKTTENNTEEMNLNTEIKKDQEVNPKYNPKDKTEVKASKEEDTTKIIVGNSKGKIITLKKVSILNHNPSIIMCMLERGLQSINSMIKSRLNFLNTTLLELKQ